MAIVAKANETVFIEPASLPFPVTHLWIRREGEVRTESALARTFREPRQGKVRTRRSFARTFPRSKRGSAYEELMAALGRAGSKRKEVASKK